MIRYRIKDLIQKKEIIEKKKIRYKDIQKETGIGLNTLSNLANNKFNPTGEIIEKLCRYFNCTPNDLMEIMDDPEQGE